MALLALERFSKWFETHLNYRDQFQHKPTDDDLSPKYFKEAETLWRIKVQKETQRIMILKKDKEVN